MSAPYTVLVGPKAVKALRALPRNVQQLALKRLGALATEPRPPGCIKMKAAGSTYRLRTGDYRIVYSVDDELTTVLVFRVGNRKDVYRS